MAGNVVRLCDLAEGQEGDFFALLAEKQQLTTRDGKPYYRVTFRDALREVNFPLWSDSAWAKPCRDEWQVGQFFKLRATLKGTTYGLQLEITLIRPVVEADQADGFDPRMCSPSSRFDAAEMFAELIAMAAQFIESPALQRLVVRIYEQYREPLLLLPAAKSNHHAYLSGYLEHVRNVTRNALWLSQQYTALYNQLTPPLDVSITVAGALLHDIGKLRELATGPAGAEYTPAGMLIGHILQGRDVVREMARDMADDDETIDEETLLRIEHIIVSHQRLPEWGSPKPPMTPEALIVHHSDDLDAKLQMMVTAISDTATPGTFSSRRNPLGHAVFRGLAPDESEVEAAAESDS